MQPTVLCESYRSATAGCSGFMHDPDSLILMASGKDLIMNGKELVKLLIWIKVGVLLLSVGIIVVLLAL